jgi:hypothetical protein
MSKLKNILKKVFVIYLAISVPFTFIYMFYNAIRGSSFNWETFFVFSVCISIINSIFLMNWLPFKRLFDAKAYDNDSNNQLTVASSIKVSTSTTQDEFLYKLRSNQYFSKARIMLAGEKIRIITGISFKSWGEIINIRMSETDGQLQYDIVSLPKQQLTVIDYGVNKKNVKIVVELLS